MDLTRTLTVASSLRVSAFGKAARAGIGVSMRKSNDVLKGNIEDEPRNYKKGNQVKANE